MRLSCTQENLTKGLAQVNRAVATRTTLPVTQHVLIETDQGRLKLSATNLELAITTWIGAKIDQEGSMTIPSRMMTDFVSRLPNETIEMESDSSHLHMNFKCASFSADITGGNSQEFPTIPTVEDGVTARVDPNLLRTAIGKVIIAAAMEETRPVLTGIKLEISGQQLTLAAADGFRLAVYKGLLVEPVSEDIEAIIPRRTLSELQRMLSDQVDPIELVVTPSKSQLVVRMKDLEMVSQLIQGAFPNYSQLIPQNYSTRSIIDLNEFSRAADLASPFAREGAGIIRLQMIPASDTNKDNIYVTSSAEESGHGEGSIEAQIEGEEAKIAFSSKYLQEVLGVLERGDVALETTNPSSPGVIKQINNEDYVHVIMPMFVQW